MPTRRLLPGHARKSLHRLLPSSTQFPGGCSALVRAPKLHFYWGLRIKKGLRWKGCSPGSGARQGHATHVTLVTYATHVTHITQATQATQATLPFW